MPTAGRDVSPLEFLQLVADPLRWRLLDELGRSDRRVGDLCELVGKPQSLVSYHLRELRAGGLVSARQSAADGRDTYYKSDIPRYADWYRGGRLPLERLITRRYRLSEINQALDDLEQRRVGRPLIEIDGSIG